MDKLLPNTTQIPNIIIDEWMPKMSAGEFKIIVIIARQTYGWHREREWLAYSQLIEKTGLNRETVAISLKSLRQNNYIEVTDRTGNILTDDILSGRRQLYYKLNLKVGKSDLLLNEKSENPSFKSRKNTNSHIYTKETNTKVIDKSINKPDGFVQRGMDILKELYPDANRLTQNRRALQWMRSKGERVYKAIRYAYENHKIQYCPQIGDFVDLYYKWNQLEAFARKNKPQSSTPIADALLKNGGFYVQNTQVLPVKVPDNSEALKEEQIKKNGYYVDNSLPPIA